MSDKFKLFSLVPDSTKEEALNPTSNLIGQAFRGIAHKVLDPLVKYNIVKDAEMEDFANKIRNKTENIPIENRDSSMLGLTYKAVEDSVYQLNAEELRNMFSNLISATVDKSKNDLVRPSFSSILKDLSATEASLFKLLFKEDLIASGSIRIQNKDTAEGIDVVTNVILLRDRFIQDESSLTTLQRFGLINIEPDTSLIADKFTRLYEQFKTSHIFKNIESQLPYTSGNLMLKDARLKKGKIELTVLGKEFGKIVID